MINFEVVWLYCFLHCGSQSAQNNLSLRFGSLEVMFLRQGSRRVAEHAPVTLERSVVLNFPISGTTCSAGAHSSGAVYIPEVSGVAGIPGGVSVEVLW